MKTVEVTQLIIPSVQFFVRSHKTSELVNYGKKKKKKNCFVLILSPPKSIVQCYQPYKKAWLPNGFSKLWKNFPKNNNFSETFPIKICDPDPRYFSFRTGLTLQICRLRGCG
uniref:Uncharacterized protein n=1 Tax=Cacopsylla melanoneura TaxID=428564 RepID=A0A8D8YEF9_9HEMI